MKTLKPYLQTLKTGPQSLSKTKQQTKFAQERTRGRTWMAIRERVLLTEPICYICKEKGLITPAKEVDHIKPLFLGGTDDMENLAGICIPCHKSKSIKERGQIEKPAIGVDGWPVD
jgi:5-methylcytosine-specific restriction endonuclease McrA